MEVQILGTGCSKCVSLAANAEQAIKELGLAADLKKVESVAEIAQMGVYFTPALAIDGDVKASGRVLTVEQVKDILSEFAED